MHSNSSMQEIVNIYFTNLSSHNIVKEIQHKIESCICFDFNKLFKKCFYLKAYREGQNYALNTPLTCGSNTNFE